VSLEPIGVGVGVNGVTAVDVGVGVTNVGVGVLEAVAVGVGVLMAVAVGVGKGGEPLFLMTKGRNTCLSKDRPPGILIIPALVPGVRQRTPY
jgi:hypothetical protein